MKKSIKNIIIIILMISVAFGVYYFIDKVGNKIRWGTATENVAENAANDEIAEEASENKEQDTEKNVEEHVENKQTESNDIKKIELSDEEIVDILIEADPFESGIELSTEKKLAIVYNALNENKINAYKNRGEGQAKVEYSAGEINGIVYSLFGVALSENKSYGTSFEYKDGKYILEHSDRGESVPVAKNIESDVAAGTMYINYDLYMSNNGKEVVVGSYAIGKSHVTSFVTCKKKM